VRSKYFYGYNIVAASFVIQGVCIGAIFTYGVFFKEFQAAFGWSRAMISGASSTSFLIMGALGILAGRLNDRVGPRLLLGASGIIFGLGYMLMSRLEMPWQLYLLHGLFAGIGLSSHEVGTLSTVARWFLNRRGMMTGIVKMGTGLGQLIGPLSATILIAVYGWRNAYLIIGAVILVALVAVAQLMRRDPHEIGLLPDGENDSTDGVDAGSTEQGVSLRKAVLTRQLWALCLAEFVILFCLMTIIVHIVPHATDLGFPPATAAGVLSMIGGVSILGRIGMGTAIDGIGGKRSLIICFMVLTCGLMGIRMAGQVWSLFLFAAIYGFAHGAFFTVMSPTVAEYFGTSSHGVLLGIVMFSGSIGAAIGPLMAGRTFDQTGSYQIVFLVLICLALFGFFLVSLLRPLRKLE